ncbi:MAG: ubiquinol-cytochrome c reductase iron-sulfur subunit [Egibacteraceae bacterium]
MSVLLLVIASAAGLLGLTAWWVWRNNLVIYPPGRGPVIRQPLPTGCDLGARLMAASAVDTAPSSSGSAPAPLAPAPKKAPQRKKPPHPTRRKFLLNAYMTAIIGSVASFTGASLFFLWPSRRGGFGGIVDVGSVEEVAAQVAAGNGQFAFPASRMYLVSYDRALDVHDNYLEITQNGEAPFMALYQKCVHLGCRVPWCDSSQWFECPCHGSRYNRWGEYEFGPAPRCLDRFPVIIHDGKVIVDTSPTRLFTGPPRQAGSLEQPPAGPHCN